MTSLGAESGGVVDGLELVVELRRAPLSASVDGVLQDIVNVLVARQTTAAIRPDITQPVCTSAL
ncbi:MAG: hypothetical protein VX785_02185 [Actinomycetota bacterium]|nr:hypothetical protein [Actinomycetota bacterium]